MRIDMKRIYCLTVTALCLLIGSYGFSQKVYFIDGYHGGVYGHYPKQYTRYLLETLEKHPDWKINIEIEPETWDSVKLKEPENYRAFQQKIADQSASSQIEYVNPAYGQGYLFNINGESIVRQFSYGIKKLNEHFPNVGFTTYSSEEPCFTSSLPRILQSFGFKYASLKNPNTCWGGYTRAFGGELINWVGPDGTKLLTVPRYEVEALDPHSTWQTIASTNSTRYLDAAFNAGISKPVGMCLQDAGWKNGPWLGNASRKYPTEYITWRNYFNLLDGQQPGADWKFSQEDVQVSLVWGAQVLQKIARQVRHSENRIIAAETLSALSAIYGNRPVKQERFDEAWRNLLLAQHHDCWIVPYNGSKGNTWIDKVGVWTGVTNSIADSSINAAIDLLSKDDKGNEKFIRVFNSLAQQREEWVQVSVPSHVGFDNFAITDMKGRTMAYQKLNDTTVVFRATVPAAGYSTYQLVSKKKPNAQHTSGLVTKQNNGTYNIETDHYRLTIDPSKGGAITSLVAKKLGNKEFVDVHNARSFNELRGYFFRDSAFRSSTENTADVVVKSDGSGLCIIEIHGKISEHPFTQVLTLRIGDPVIDVALNINWKKNVGIGDAYKQSGGFDFKDYRKAFYDDSMKLQTFFPAALDGQSIYKDAPFDVTKSTLSNTFFQTWDSIKNNIILNWVDVMDKKEEYGMAIFSDHTTSYGHGENYPLSLITQYSGVGLWGRSYSITEPTSLRYAIVPHERRWDKARLWSMNSRWNTPLMGTLLSESIRSTDVERSLVRFSGNTIELSAMYMDDKDLVVRCFNASPDGTTQKLIFDGTADKVVEEEMNGVVVKDLERRVAKNKTTIAISMPKFGITTIRLTNFKGSH